MAYEQKEGSGALFKNDKQGNEARPDYRGDICIKGAMYSLSAWLKKSSKGDTFMSLNAQPKDARAEQKPASKNTDFDEDDIPF